MSNNYQNIIEYLWENPTSREDFMTEPKSYLEKQGLEIPENVLVSAYADTSSQYYLVLPPDGTEIPENDNPETKIIGRALQDSVYKARLLENPQAAAEEIGIELLDSMTIIVLQDSEDQMHFVIPVNPSDSELSEADLETIAGGASSYPGLYGNSFGGTDFGGFGCGCRPIPIGL
ncbi:hypothetical protein H1P_90012 [Hyella patelloides LEGE 07179]|uniref:Nitrile hydratase alpha /Thiocyanate hydrolase gamma domain-containing protein n=1 Tax=Hyella patelloides LEGE 07179 TaxID=945734 RepID=A0A563W517_9CYAN|nr:NHLP leader peptide family RiPP precursor [Hyella patelloides]VEP18765.1 hypothetical protein H1P_90012 [Hyella patelloides LEGE 07179]